MYNKIAHRKRLIHWTPIPCLLESKLVPKIISPPKPRTCSFGIFLYLASFPSLILRIFICQHPISEYNTLNRLSFYTAKDMTSLLIIFVTPYANSTQSFAPPFVGHRKPKQRVVKKQGKTLAFLTPNNWMSVIFLGQRPIIRLLQRNFFYFAFRKIQQLPDPSSYLYSFLKSHKSPVR